MTDTREVLSPCKVNEFLYITGLMPDGYSFLQTMYTVLDYGDQMEFTVREDGNFTLEGFDFPMEQNLIYKAARALKQKTLSPLGADIRVKKILNEGGGLGGGSGNAATTLIELNRMWNCSLLKKDLLDLGAELGADVPLFIEGGSTFGEYRGTVLTPVPSPGGWYVVACPRCHVPTAELFKMPDLKRDCPRRTFDELIKLPFENVFTDVVTKRYPEVAELIEIMSTLGKPRMSGSGGSCFLWFADEDQAKSAFSSLRSRNINVFMAKPLRKNAI